MTDSPFNDRNCFRFDDVLVDRENFRLLKDGEIKKLTPRAFDLLIYLIERRERVVEKQELFEAVWGEAFVTDNALTRAVKEIRRELGDRPADPRYIETVHKRGYRFIAELVEAPRWPAPTEEKDDANGASPGNAEQTGAMNGPGADSEALEAPMSEADRPSLAAGPVNFRPEMEKGVRADATGNRTPARRRRYALAAGALIVLAVAAWWLAGGARRATPIDSLAVLPFVNETGDAELDYLTDGMTESLIGSLSRLPNLKVKARSSVFRYKNRDASAATVGRELNVPAVLTGRVVKRGEELTLYLSLIDAAGENNLWSLQYQRRLTNLPALQNEIARDVAARLGAHFAGTDAPPLTAGGTSNPEAYQLYLKGRYQVLKLTPESTEQGIDYFRRAIELDPNYALAHAGVADAYFATALTGEVAPRTIFPQARAAVDRALEIDERLAEAHAILSGILLFYEWDTPAAENHARRAVELNPNSADTRLNFASLLSNTKRYEQGLAEIKRARELDPLNWRTAALEGMFLTQAGRADEALERFEQILQVEPNFYLAHLFGSVAYLEKQRYGEAIEAARRASRSLGGGKHPLGYLGYALAKAGREREARAVLEELLQLSGERYISALDIALIYYGLGDREAAFSWLDRAVEQRDVRAALLRVMPPWKDLREDQRFAGVLDRVGVLR